MSGTRSYEPWTFATRKGILLRKKQDRGWFENAYKDKYMCWLSSDTLHMRAAEVVTFRSNQNAQVTEKVVVAGKFLRETLPILRFACSRPS
jgi:hypothetical protein